LVTKYKSVPDFLRGHKLPEKGDPLETANNVACKMLSGFDDKDPLISVAMHLESAKKKLNDLYFVGITEKIEESITLFYSLLDWHPPERIHPFNVSDDDEQFTPEILEGIAERNWADIDLYQYALELYEARRQTIIVRHIPKNPEFVRSVSYRFNQSLNGYGWGSRNGGDHSYRTSRRWVNETDEAAIDFWLESGVDYNFRFILFVQPLFFKQLTVFVNGVLLDLTYNPFENPQNFKHEKVECRCIIPRDILKQGDRTRIIFKMTPPTEEKILKKFLTCKNHFHIYDQYVKGHFACDEIIISTL